MTNPTFRRVKEYFQVESEDIMIRPDESSALYNDELMEKMGGDFRHVFLLPPDGYEPVYDEEGVITNEFGIKKNWLTACLRDTAVRWQMQR